MRILLYGINYLPELTGIGKYTGELGTWLAQNNKVDVITALPYYPEWNIHDSYNQKFWHKEVLYGATVYRCPLYVPKNVTSLNRVFHEFSFVLSSIPFWVRVIFNKRYDIVICVSPPFHLGFIPLLYSKFRNVPLICHIQDLQVDAARELGMLKNKKFLKILFQAEKFILKRCTVISTISAGMLIKIKDKGIREVKYLHFPNWVDDRYIKPLNKENSLRAEFGLKDIDKVILYSGSLGEKQGLDIIVHVAHEFSVNKDIQFIIVGSGSGKIRLEFLVKQYQLDNVKFFPLQPYEKLSALLATADLHMVLQKKSASDLVMPSKLTSILSAGGCAIVTAIPGTSLYEIIDKYKMGILIEPESVVALKAGIEKALAEDLNIYRRNARVYAEQYLTKVGILSEFEQKLINIVATDESVNQSDAVLSHNLPEEEM